MPSLAGTTWNQDAIYADNGVVIRALKVRGTRVRSGVSGDECGQGCVVRGSAASTLDRAFTPPSFVGFITGVYIIWTPDSNCCIYSEQTMATEEPPLPAILPDDLLFRVRRVTDSLEGTLWFIESQNILIIHR